MRLPFNKFSFEWEIGVYNKFWKNSIFEHHELVYIPGGFKDEMEIAEQMEASLIGYLK